VCLSLHPVSATLPPSSQCFYSLSSQCFSSFMQSARSSSIPLFIHPLELLYLHPVSSFIIHSALHSSTRAFLPSSNKLFHNLFCSSFIQLALIIHAALPSSTSFSISSFIIHSALHSSTRAFLPSSNQLFHNLFYSSFIQQLFLQHFCSSCIQSDLPSTILR
jgi:hypothetical protein